MGRGMASLNKHIWATKFKSNYVAKSAIIKGEYFLKVRSNCSNYNPCNITHLLQKAAQYSLAYLTLCAEHSPTPTNSSVAWAETSIQKQQLINIKKINMAW